MKSQIVDSIIDTKTLYLISGPMGAGKTAVNSIKLDTTDLVPTQAAAMISKLPR